MGNWLYPYALAAAALAAGCGGDSSAGESRKQQSAAAAAARAATADESPAPEPAPSARAGLTPWRPLLDEAGRAELDSDGLLIDLGTADGHKYTLGGWETGWSKNTRAGGATFAAMTSRSARLELLLRQPRVRAIVMRARSQAPAQSVSVALGGRAIGAGAIGADWGVVRIPVKGKTRAGTSDLALSLRNEHASGVHAEVDWIWLDTGKQPREPMLVPRVAPLKLGGRLRRALVAPTARAYSFYLHVPEGGVLTFDYGARPAVAFSVHAEPTEGQRVELFRADGTAAWQQARVDLSQLAGQAIRLELRTEGPPALAGWGEPVLSVPGDRRRQRDDGARAKNLIVIVLDTVRADAFGTVDPDTPVKTPAFDAFARTGTAFAHAYNNENWTKPSVATLLSGLYPESHDTRFRESILPDDVELLSEHLKKRGFATGAVIANRVVSSGFGFDQGWDAFLRALGAESVYDQAIGWLGDRKPDERFFLYLQPFEPHVPYEVDPKYSGMYYEGTYTGAVGAAFDGTEQAQVNDDKLKLSGDDHAWIRALYRGEISYHDEQFGRFIEHLEQTGRLDDTLVVFTNDHGEEFGEHGRLGHGWTLYDPMLRAPLVMHYPPLFPARRLSEVVEHVDVAATALEAMGVEALSDSEGLSLLPIIRGEAGRLRPYYAVSWARGSREGRAIRVGRWKYSVGGQLWAGLYDLQTDPGETQDLTGKRPIPTRLAQVYLGEALATRKKTERLGDVSTARQFDSPNAQLDEKTRKELEALGYFGDGNQ